MAELKLIKNDECVERMLNGDISLETINNHAVVSTPDFMLVHDHVQGKWFGADWEELGKHLSEDDQGDVKAAAELILAQ